MQTAPRTRLSAEQRGAQISAAARQIALANGLDTVTLRAVAAEAGVAPALVAHYVPSMDALVAETFTAIVIDELGELKAVTDRAPDARSALLALLDTLLDGSRDEVTLVWVQGWGLGGRTESLAIAVREAMDAWEAYLEAIVAGGVATGELRVDDPRGAALLLLGMIDGLNAHALVRWRDAPQRRALLAVALEAMLGMPRGALAAT